MDCGDRITDKVLHSSVPQAHRNGIKKKKKRSARLGLWMTTTVQGLAPLGMA